MAHAGMSEAILGSMAELRAGREVDVDVVVAAALPDLVRAIDTKDEAALRRITALLHPVRAELLSGSAATSDGCELLGALTAISETARFAADRFEGPALINGKTVPGRMLALIVKQDGLTNTEIMDRLRQSETSVSHAGRRLSALGLAYAVRIGRENHWEATLRGRHDALQAGVSAGEASASTAVGVRAKPNPAKLGREDTPKRKKGRTSAGGRKTAPDQIESKTRVLESVIQLPSGLSSVRGARPIAGRRHRAVDVLAQDQGAVVPYGLFVPEVDHARLANLEVRVRR
jgi:hypothetical protein